ncbi:hypothetical protein ACHHYP_20402 [Achlya hypogyna]|uniref:HIT domain-containing protein n=1 Tax=Achlya hypogyna TaxID=1202772 RepID=A0A1V9YNL6_ACHHY|nr:hypothetical protein ACHHYP_20402 [Achlya hypogyna]
MVKVLLSGDVGTAWSTLCTRVQKLHASAHGPFDLVLCTGKADVAAVDVEAWPMPVYVLGTAGAVPPPSTNLHIVTENQVLDLCGLQVAFVPDDAGATAMAATLGPVDVLVTADFPDGYDQLLPEKVPAEIQHVGSKAARLAAVAATPRYHIVGTHGFFHQHLPYVTTVPGVGRRVSRLIALGHVGASTDKAKKWLHALNLMPLDASATVDIPAGTTQSPFDAAPPAKRFKADALSADVAARLVQKSAAASQFRYDPAVAATGQGAHEKLRRPVVAYREECWFCLATPTVETHLLVSIGDEAYVAIPKGPIVPDHVLIVPIQHVSSMAALKPAAAAEVQRFQEALAAYFASVGKALVTMDRNVATLGAAHAHLQLVPVPRDAVDHIEHICREEGKQYHVDFKVLPPEAPAPTDAEYFLISFSDGHGGRTRLYHRVRGKHYMQFGRRVAATLLGMPEREDWKSCVVPKDDETKMAADLKAAFAPFDFTLS